ncbi:MAG: ATP-binding protein [Candidatus Poribacteria bacterium]|nr:ATP-binding protein [Candidatus Poribacteria bacterium]
MPEDFDQDLSRSLAEAFQSFDAAGEKLTRAYAELEKKLENVNQELERTNQELSQSLQEKERLHNHLVCILESMIAGVVAVDLHGRITLFNQMAEKLIGITATDVIGRPYEEIFPDRRFLVNTLKMLESYPSHEGFIQQNGSSEPIPVEISTTLITDTEGEVSGALELIRDISRRKQLEEQLGRSKALAELGKMAAEVAHDLRNPLGAIQLYAGLLQQELADDRRHMADAIVAGINSLEFITYNLLSLARPMKPNFQFVDLAELIDSEIILTVHAMEEKNITLIRDYHRNGQFMCYADCEQLKQVTLNLILNAIQAMQDGGTLRLMGRTDTNKDVIILSVEDNGPGIPRDIQEKIFTPFFTTKASGTGLGLHTVNRIVQAHYGHIRVQSTEGRGTKFIIEFPVDARTKQMPIFSVNAALRRE